MNTQSDYDFFGKESISKILLKVSPPVMLAQLIQALYNIVDSFFVGRYSADALTAVTVIYPMQLIIIALAVGTGVGVNTYMARKYAQHDEKSADAAAGTCAVLAFLSWAVFAAVAAVIMPRYVSTSAKEPGAVAQAITYGNIVCIGSLGTFLEGTWSKVHQAKGNMLLPMIAQVAGALINVIFDPLLIFGIGFFPKLGAAGAAYATIFGQFTAAVIVGIKGFRIPPRIAQMPHYVKRIYLYGYSSIFMQALYTVYIVGLNVTLASFSDSAVTVLGLYYKAQSFFFIPLFGLETCIVPVISYNYTAKSYDRCRETMRISFMASLLFMIFGVICFVIFPKPLIRLFSTSEQVMEIGRIAFPIIGSSFLPAVFSLMLPVFFQAIGKGIPSMFMSLMRQIFLLLPVFKLLSKIGLNYTWFAFPIAEVVSGAIGMMLYFSCIRKWQQESNLII